MSDFRDIILSQKEGKEVEEWEGTVLDYLYLIKENPNIVDFASGRIYNTVEGRGTEEVDQSLKTRGYDDLVSYKFFDDIIYGTKEPIHDIVKWLKAAARRTETGKRILILVGPTASGKSTIATALKRGLENDKTPKYVIKGCPIGIGEEPLHVIPHADRPYWEDQLGIKIEGVPCPMCQKMIDENYTEDGVVSWEKIPVVSSYYSEQRRCGIGTFSPSDPKCVKWDTVLFCDNGMLSFEELQERVKSNVEEFKDLEITVDGIEGVERTSKFFNNGIQHINKIKTMFGYEIECTDVHPLLVLEDGNVIWKETSNLKEGDYVSIKKGSMLFGNDNILDDFNYNGSPPASIYVESTKPTKMTPELAKVMGYLVADGSICKRDIWFTNTNKDLVDDFNLCFEKVFNVKPKVYERTNIFSVSISSEMLTTFFLDVLDMKKGAYNKHVPLCIRKSDKVSILSFLDGLFWGDGTISTRKKVKSNRFKYASVSKELAKQVHLMLLNLGIISCLDAGIMNYNNNLCYTVTVTGDTVLDLLELIPSLKNKKTDNGDFIGKKDRSNWDVIPNVSPLFREVMNDIRKNVGPIYKTELKKYERYQYPITKKRPRRSTVLAFCNESEKILNRSSEVILELRNICGDNDTVWLPIVDITDAGFDQVYDLTVPSTNSFCANGFINHNSQDVSELIGRPNMAKLSRYGETDPRGFEFNGELQVANGGMVEMIELLKTDIKLQYVLISLAQEQVIKSPGFPQMYIDTFILAHTNQTEYDIFKADKKNEALHSRMYPIKVPLNLIVDDEIKIYKKMIKESDFKDIHIAPNALKVAAQFAVLSRLKPSKKVSSIIEKMKIYNGEITEEFKKTEIDVKTLKEEGKGMDEGMTGIDPRFIINALDIALGMKEDKKCINPIDVIRTLRQNFEHQIGITDEEKEKYINLLISDKDSVNCEYKEVAKKAVNMAFIYAYEDQAQALFGRYMENSTAFCKKEKIIDDITGEISDPDEKLMRSLEELIGVPVNSKSEFRNGLFVYKSDALERGEDFGYNDYDPLRDAIEKKLMSDLKNVVNLSIADTTSTNPKSKKKREKAMELLLENGYCESCAQVLLKFVGEILKKQ